MDFHINYLTTCLVNGKRYTGAHSTDNLEDGYLGSGVLLLKDVKLYGEHNFNMEILKFCETHRESRYNERFFIKEFNTLYPNGYNLDPNGGYFSPSSIKKLNGNVTWKIYTAEEKRKYIEEKEEKEEITIQRYKTGFNFAYLDKLDCIYSCGLIKQSDYFKLKNCLINSDSRTQFEAKSIITDKYYDYYYRYC